MRQLLSAISLVSAVPFLLAGCATTGAQRTVGPLADVVGVMTLPEGMSADAVCPNLTVDVTTAEGVKVGDTSVHTSRNRCSYTVANVPAGVPLKLAVASSVPGCNDGSLVAKSVPEKLTLQEKETRNLDVALQCSDAGSAGK